MNPIVVQVGHDEILPHFPSKRGDAFSLRLKRPSDPHSIGMDRGYVDPSTARVLRMDRFDQQPLGVRIIRLLTLLHYGTIGGYPTRVLWIAAGLMPGVLFCHVVASLVESNALEEMAQIAKAGAAGSGAHKT